MRSKKRTLSEDYLILKKTSHKFGRAFMSSCFVMLMTRTIMWIFGDLTETMGFILISIFFGAALSTIYCGSGWFFLFVESSYVARFEKMRRDL